MNPKIYVTFYGTESWYFWKWDSARWARPSFIKENMLLYKTEWWKESIQRRAALERVPRVPGTRKILSSYVMAPVSFYEISREQLPGTRKVLRTLIHGTRGLKFLMTPRLVYCHAIWLWLLGKNQSWKDKEHLGMFEHHILAINRSSLFKQKCALIYSAIALLLNLASGKKNLFSTISFYFSFTFFKCYSYTLYTKVCYH